MSYKDEVGGDCEEYGKITQNKQTMNKELFDIDGAATCGVTCTRAGSARRVDSMNTPRTAESTNTWITPRDVLAPLGHFDLDPCAADAMPWPTADRMLTKADDGLAHEWKGRVWLNPPYGREAEPFVRRMAEHDGGGLALLFMRSDSRWFQDLALARARFMFLYRGRIRFCREDGAQGGAPNAPSVLVAWDPREAPVLFALQVAGLGKVAIL